MDSFSIMGSSFLESQGEKLDENIKITDLCYCVSCESLHFGRERILTHSCSYVPGIHSLGYDRREDAILVIFLSWLLPQVIVNVNGERLTKHFDHRLFTSLCNKKLVGAPKYCYIGGFLLWVLTRTWSMDYLTRKYFLDELFCSQGPEVNYKMLDARLTALTKNYDFPPTICIYDVNKEVSKDLNDIYKNCYDDDYDKEAYLELKNSNRADLEYELDMCSLFIADGLFGGAVIKKNEEVAAILSGSKKKFSTKTALEILSSGHRFTVDEAGRFLVLFPEDRARSLVDPATDRYEKMKEIWNMYGPKKDTMCFDPDDPTTWEYFDEKGRREMFPIRDQFYNCGRPLRGDPVFELLSITIRELGPNRKFSSIYMQSDMKSSKRLYIPLVIYKLPEGKEVDIGKPLPLKGPFRLPNPNLNLVISFTTSNTLEAEWQFVHSSFFFKHGGMRYEKPWDNIVTTDICMDYRGSSLATIKYRLSSSALRAELSFTFFDDVNHTITVTDGYIVATDDGDVRTMRVVKEYNQETPVCLRNGQRLKVDRCVFGVPTGFFLRVKVKLVFFVDTSPNEKRTIEGYHDFEMPVNVETQGLIVPASGGSTARLCVECFWSCDN